MPSSCWLALDLSSLGTNPGCCCIWSWIWLAAMMSSSFCCLSCWNSSKDSTAWNPPLISYLMRPYSWRRLMFSSMACIFWFACLSWCTCCSKLWNWAIFYATASASDSLFLLASRISCLLRLLRAPAFIKLWLCPFSLLRSKTRLKEDSKIQNCLHANWGTLLVYLEDLGVQFDHVLFCGDLLVSNIHSPVDPICELLTNNGVDYIGYVISRKFKYLTLNHGQCSHHVLLAICVIEHVLNR